MHTIYTIILSVTLLIACTTKKEISSIDPNRWDLRTSSKMTDSTFEHGSTYLSVYSEIYSQTEHKTHDLTVTVSMRNANLSDTVYIDHATYYDTKGHMIRTYFDKTIFITPLETVEIVIDEFDPHGGTGGNFLFDWKIGPKVIEPIFEGIMISTSGQQGLSFTTEGKRIK